MGITRGMGRRAHVRRRCERGQMTVELAVAFPVLIIVAVIAVNALTFFSECSSFDNVFRDAVRIHAASPASGQGVDQSAAMVQATLAERFDAANETARVTVEGATAGHLRFSATLEYAPTLFGLGLRSSVFGIALPPLTHAATMTLDCYKPGVLL